MVLNLTWWRNSNVQRTSTQKKKKSKTIIIFQRLDGVALRKLDQNKSNPNFMLCVCRKRKSGKLQYNSFDTLCGKCNKYIVTKWLLHPFHCLLFNFSF